MGKEHYHHTVDIVLERGGDLYLRIAALAEAQGLSLEVEMGAIAEAGLLEHMTRNVECMEAYVAKCAKAEAEQ